MVRIGVTGRPGIGKTTLCKRVYEKLKALKRVSGFITEEVREKGRRVGFEVVDLESGERFMLAGLNPDGSNVRVGKYFVYLDRFEEYIRGLKLSEVVIVDEVGPMELKSKAFVNFVDKVIERDNILLTLHQRSRHPVVERAKRAVKLYTIDEKNRDAIAEKVFRELAAGF